MIPARPWLRCGLWYLRRPHLPGQAALADLLDRRLQARPLTGTARTRFGAAIPAVSSDLIQRYLLLFGVWEPQLTHWMAGRIRPGDTVIDVGANIGYFTLLAAHLAGPAGHVVAIEAAPTFHQALTAAVHANHATINSARVRAVHAAVSDAPARLAFYQPEPGNLGATSAVRPRTPTRPSFETDAHALPDLLTAQELAAARIIKIDVEGAEAAAVAGLADHLDRLHPDAELVIEVSWRLLRRQGRSVEEVTGPLIAAGFHPYLLANDYRARSYPDALRRPAAPVRLHPPFTGLRDPSDLVFSRTDADRLP